MKYRVLGRTGYQVSEIGYGAWGIGKNMWVGADDDQSLRALHSAVDGGLNFIDTALVYGNGHSERIVGAFVKERKERIIVATKVPPKNFRWPARGQLVEAFPADHIVKSTHESLRNLAVDTIDLLQLHVWDPSWIAHDEWYETLCRLRDEGKIRYFGVSVNDHLPGSAVELVRSGKIDTVQVIYNIFDQKPEEELFPACHEMNVGVIVRVPLDEGALTGKITPETTFPKKDWRNRYFEGDRKKQVYERALRLETLLGQEAASLPELALRFCLHHPDVGTVIPGMRKLGHVASNLAVSDGRRLSAGLLTKLRAHAWEKNFYPE